MNLPLQITVHNASVSEAVKEDIHKKAMKLERFSDSIIGCRIIVDSPHRRRHQGVLYDVRIDLTVPGSELIVRRQPNEDIYVAIRDAFDAAREKLADYERRLRGEVKSHRSAPSARVIKLFPKTGYGFLESPGGYEVYFHKNSVLQDAFKQLKVGTKVRYIEEQGEKGPQASMVKIAGKHRDRRS
jgi:ribosomal subunit interface protein